MKKAMLFFVALFFSVAANAATYNITDTAGTVFALIGNGTETASASFQGDAEFELEVVGPAAGPTLVNFDFIPEASFVSGTMSIDGTVYNLAANFDLVVALAVGTYDVIFDITPDGTGIQQFSVSSVPVPAAAWLFAPALLGLVGLRRKSA
jgi:hypothetical protein